MIKYLFILGLIFTLSSCNCSNRTYFTVYDFQSDIGNKCMYSLHHGGRADGGIYISIIDTCGKYQVGDTLTLSKLK